MDRKARLLSQISEWEIFRRYLGSNIKPGKCIVSPLRDDKNPSFNIFRTRQGKWRYNDFGGDHGDCFDLVRKLYRVDFKDALGIIERDFGIIQGEQSMRIPRLPIIKRTVKKFNWDEVPLDTKYWNEYGIGLDILEMFRVKQVVNVKLITKEEEMIIPYQHPVYMYTYDSGNVRFYSPLSTKYKHIGNATTADIFGIVDQRHPMIKDKAEELVICAGQKDAMSLMANMGIPAIALSSENCLLTAQHYSFLSGICNKLSVCYDNDKTGHEYAVKMNEQWDVDIIKVNEGFKDISDYFKSINQLTNNQLTNDNQNETNIHERERKRSSWKANTP